MHGRGGSVYGYVWYVDGVRVSKGMKSGDVDPRGKTVNCMMVSDKATAIGGGVLEAILSYAGDRL